MSALALLDEQDLGWIANAVDVVQAARGQPWRIALDQLERGPTELPAPSAARIKAVTGALLRVAGGGGRNAALARRLRRLALGQPAVDSESRERRIAEAARAAGIGTAEVELGMWADLPRERPVELPAGRPSELEVAALANVHLIQRAIGRAQAVTIRIWGDPGAVLRVAALRGLLATISLGDQRATVIEIVGPLALFHRTSVYGRALAGLVPVLASCERFELEIKAETGGKAYTMTLASPVLLPAAAPFVSATSLAAKLARDLEQRAPQLRVTREPPAILAGTAIVCPDLVLEHAGAAWHVEIVGFWTAPFLASKLERYRAAGLHRVILCVDDARACADDEPPGGATVIRYERRVGAREILEAIGSRSGAVRVALAVE